MKVLPVAIALLLATAAAACQRNAAPGADPAAPLAPVATPTPLPPVVEGAEMVYACHEDQMSVVYALGEARVALADGRRVVLAQTPGQGETGADMYNGQDIQLQRSRQDGSVTLRQKPSQAVECMELSATA